MLFQTLSHTFKLHVSIADLLATWAWFFFWAPVSMVLYTQVFVQDAASFTASWGEFARILDQVYELTTRRVLSVYLLVHHMVAVLIVLLLLEWDPVASIGRAVYIFAPQSCLDRLIYVVFPMSHLRKQYDALSNSASVMLHTGALGALDRAAMASRFPHVLRFAYRAAFVWYCSSIIVRTFTLVSVVMFLTMYWDEISAAWHIALPVVAVFFCVIDVDFYLLLHARGFKFNPSPSCRNPQEGAGGLSSIEPDVMGPSDGVTSPTDIDFGSLSRASNLSDS